jgi:hypothetical protein
MCRHGRAKIPVLFAIRDALRFRLHHNTLRTIPAMLQRDQADLADGDILNVLKAGEQSNVAGTRKNHG